MDVMELLKRQLPRSTYYYYRRRLGRGLSIEDLPNRLKQRLNLDGLTSRLTLDERFEKELLRFPVNERSAIRRHCLFLAGLVREWMVAPPQQRAEICARAAATDPVWLSRYPSDRLPPSMRTFARWVARYKKEGLVAFLRRRPSLSGADSRFAKVPSRALEWLKANLRNYTDGKKILISHLGKEWIEVGKREGWNLPWKNAGSRDKNSCYHWLRRWVASIPDVARLLVVNGERKLAQTVAPIVRRYDDLAPWEAFTADWRPFDVIVNRFGRLVRLHLCPVVDLASRALAGFCIEERPSARGVRLAVLDAISRSKWKKEIGVDDILCGLPVSSAGRQAFIHFDNGKEFTAYDIEGKPTRVTIELENQLITVFQMWNLGLAHEIQLKIRRARPFSPRGKLAEWFYTFVARWEKTIPGYRGRTPDEKPHWFQAAWRAHHQLAKRGQPKLADIRQLPPKWVEYYEKTGSIFPLEEDFREWFIAFVDEYLHTPQRGLRDAFGELSPIDFLRRNPHPIELPSDWALAQMLMDYKEVTVRHGVIEITWHGQRFKYVEPSGSTALLQLPHRAKVEFRFNSSEIGRGWVFYQGRFVTVVEQPELLSWRATTDELKRALSRQREHVRFAQEWVNGASVQAAMRAISRSRSQFSRQSETKIVRLTRYDFVPQEARQPRVVKLPKLRLWDESDEEGLERHRLRMPWEG